jgi:hypothetical protein
MVRAISDRSAPAINRAGFVGSSLWDRTLACANALSDSQGERRADSYRSPGQLLQVEWDVTIDEHRVPPVVKADELGQELGAQAVGLARDRIDP